MSKIDKRKCNVGTAPKLYAFRGQILSVAQIAPLLGVSQVTVRRRISGDRVLERDELPPPYGARTLTFRGATLTYAQWAERLGTSRQTLHERIHQYNWPLELALSQPVMTTKQRNRVSYTIKRMIQLSTGGWSATSPASSGTGGGPSRTILEPAE